MMSPLTGTSGPPSSRPPAWHRLLLAAFCCAIWLPGLPARSLWPTDEPRYAMIAREMVRSGDYVVPIKRGEIYHSQPPLFLWSEALALSATGSTNEAVLRIPSFLAGLGGVLIVQALAASWFGPLAGLLSGLVLATDLRYLLQAQWISTDMLLCLFMTAALACFIHGYRSGKRRWYLATYALVATATMTKGPIGFVLPGLVILIFLVVRKDLGEVIRMKLPAGALIFLAVVLPWYLMFWHRAGADEALNLIMQQSFRRYVAAWNNQQPWHFFFWMLPADLLPWSLVIPCAAWMARTRMPAQERSFLYCWIGVMFVFFSISTGKRGVYLLPLHPACAILTGWFWDAAPRAAQDAPMARALKASALLTAALFAAAGIWGFFFSSGHRGLDPQAAPAAWILGGVALAAAAAIALSRRPLAPWVTAGATGVLALTALTVAAPIQNRRVDVTAFSAEIARYVPEGATLGIVRDRYEELVYYSGRAASDELKSGKRLERWMTQPQTVYAVLDHRSLDYLQSRSVPPWEVLARGDLAGEEYYLIVKR